MTLLMFRYLTSSFLRNKYQLFILHIIRLKISRPEIRFVFWCVRLEAGQEKKPGILEMAQKG